MDLDRADKLLALSTDDSTTEEERRTAAMTLARMMKDNDFLTIVRSAADAAERVGRRLADMGLL